MRPLLARATAQCTRMLRRVDRRIGWIERALQLELAAIEAARLRTACHDGGLRMGHFYHWKIEQLALISCMRGMPRDRFLRLAARVDRSDYQRLDDVLAEPGRGLLLATPHHGHFVLSIIAAAERMRAHRRVSIFYEAPSAHASNAVFDAAHACLFGQGGAVSIIHNTRAGLVQAIRELRAGQVVIIMPDVYRSAEETWQIPFCGGYRNTMLGTAVLARRTGARILPMVSRTGTSLFEFDSHFSPAMEALPAQPGAIHETYADYTITARLFAAMEPAMQGQMHAWQYTRGHQVQAAAETDIALADMLELGRLLLADPRMQLAPPSPRPAAA